MKARSVTLTGISWVSATLLLATSPLAHADPVFKLGLYGQASAHSENTYLNVQDFTPNHRWRTDLDQLVFEPEIEFTPKLELETEVEFEHGGAGTALEYSPFEEAGEFESEVEQGGEVRIEKFQLLYKAKSWFNIKGGYFTVPIGWSGIRDLPMDHFTVERSRSEGNVIPLDWSEMGVGITGEVGMFNYEYDFVSGLDSEFFRKYSWIAPAGKRRLESSFSDDWAHAVRLDYGFARDHRVIGASLYYGNATGARQKDGKLTEPSEVLIGDVHALYSWEGFKLRALYLRGYLTNANLVGLANASLPGVANPAGFASVGKQSEAGYAELGYDLKHLWPEFFELPFDVFGRYDHWDSMKEAPTHGTRDPRFRASTWTAGMNAYIYKQDVLLKLQYASVRSGLDSIPTDHQIALGLGFRFFPRAGDAEDEIL